MSDLQTALAHREFLLACIPHAIRGEAAPNLSEWPYSDEVYDEVIAALRRAMVIRMGIDQFHDNLSQATLPSAAR